MSNNIRSNIQPHNSDKQLSYLSLSRRYSIYLILVITFILIAFSILAIVYNQSKVTYELDQQMAYISTMAENSLSTTVWNYDNNTAVELIRTLFAQDFIVFAKVTAENESILAQETRSDFAGKDFDYFKNNSQFVTNRIDIQYKLKKIGTFKVAISKEKLKHELFIQVMGISILVLVIILAIALTSLWVTRKYVFLPISNLYEAAYRLMKGDLNANIDITRKDEINDLALCFKDMRNAIQNKISELELAEKKYRSIFEKSAEGIFQMTVNGKFITANPALVSILGFDSPLELMEKVNDFSTQLLVDPNHRKVIQNTINAQGEILNFETQVYKKNKSIIHVSISARFIQELDKDRSYYEGSISDISERIGKEKAEKESQSALAATEAKSEFLANMSHEIRTPINAIIGLTYLALRTSLTGKQKDYLDKIKKSSSRLLGIVDDILDFSKIESGNLEIECAQFDLNQVLNELSNLMGIQAEEKGLELHFKVGDDVPCKLFGDALRVLQILINLTSNAIKFTQQGYVLIKIDIDPEVNKTTDRIRLQFKVEDTGMGMPSEQISYLFQFFSQADSSLTRKAGGTGLGLAICKRLVELLGGHQIKVDSKSGIGSAFSFDLEFKVYDPAKMNYVVPDFMPDLKVLAVDDNTMALEIMGDILKSLNLRVSLVASGKSAVKKFNQEKQADPFQLIIVDWKMPDMDGLETIARIREQDHNIPVIITSAFDSKAELTRLGANMGINAILAKPFVKVQLLNAILQVFGLPPTVEYRNAQMEAFDFSRLDKVRGSHILLVEDNEINQQVAKEVLESAEFYVTLAQNGKKAIEIIDNAGDKDVVDLILMDIQMPEMDGYEATRLIRANQKYKEVPIIALTAHAMVSERKKAFLAGMNDYVTKPIEAEKLFETLLRWIAPRDRKRPVYKSLQVEEDIALPDDLPGIDIQLGLSHVGGRKSFFVNLLQKLPSKYQNIVNDIHQNLKDSDYAAMEKTVHTLKGVAGNIGATALFDATLSLETDIRENRMFQLEQKIDILDMELEKVMTSIESLDHVIPNDNLSWLPPEINEISDMDVEESLDLLSRYLDEGDKKQSKQVLYRLNNQILDETINSDQQSHYMNELKQIEALIDDYEFELAANKLSFLFKTLKAKQGN